MSYLFHSDETEADPSNKDNGDNGDNGYNGYNGYNGGNGHNGDNGYDERLVFAMEHYGNILLIKEAMNMIKNYIFIILIKDQLANNFLTLCHQI